MCTTTGAPPPQVTWSLDGVTFDPNDTRVEMPGMALLIVSNVTVNDSGVYHCVAMSTAGAVATSRRVTILDPGVGGSRVIMGQLSQFATIPCLEGLPPGAAVMWEFAGMSLAVSDKYFFAPDGSLVLTEVEDTDAGTYTCSVDSIMSSTQLTIVGEPGRLPWYCSGCMCDKLFCRVLNSTLEKFDVKVDLSVRKACSGNISPLVYPEFL